MSGPPLREVLCVVLDVNKSMGPHFAVAKECVRSMILNKLVFSPRDEVGLVCIGSDATLNRLNKAMPDQYHNVSVAHPISGPTTEYFNLLDKAHTESGPSDILDGLVVAADLIHERVGDKRFRRRVLLVTDSAGKVKKKEDLPTLIKGFKAKETSLVVIALNPVVKPDSKEGNWATMSVKEQNERVCLFMCNELSGSMVIPADDAFEALKTLRKKTVQQRAFNRLVLDIGGTIQIPVQLVLKTSLQRVPTMKRSSTKGEVTTDRRYFSVQNPTEEVPAGARVKGFRYGKTFIPLSEVDEDQMNLQTFRSMTVLGFVPIDEVQQRFVAMSAVYAVAPIKGDATGAAAFSAFVQGMDHLQRAMLIRYCRYDNSPPRLGVCFPSAKPNRDILYFYCTPYAEDTRCYQFPHFSTEPKPADKAMEAVVDALELADDVLNPKEVFNPVLQHYYAALQERFIKPDAPFPALDAAVRKSSCSWDEDGNVLRPMLDKAKTAIAALSAALPLVAKKEEDKKHKDFWFVKGHEEAVLDAYDGTEGASKKPRKENYFGSGASGTTADSSLRGAVDVTQGGAMSIGTVDPVKDFLRLVGDKTGDKLSRALFELSEVIFRLLRESIGEQFYSRISLCIDAMRKTCIVEGEPKTFNTFLKNLMNSIRGESHDKYWTAEVVARGVLPITSKECPESSLTEDEVEAFMAAAVARTKPREENFADEEDLFGQLE